MAVPTLSQVAVLSKPNPRQLLFFRPQRGPVFFPSLPSEKTSLNPGGFGGLAPHVLQRSSSELTWNRQAESCAWSMRRHYLRHWLRPTS